MKRLELVLVVLCLLLVGSLVALSNKLNTNYAASEFTRLAEDGVQGLDSRIETYVQSLRGTLAFLNGNSNVSKEQFSRFVEDLKLAEFLPGINGIGFIEPVMESDLVAYAEEARASGYPEFQIKPDTPFEENFVIRHVFPEEPNAKAIGLNVTFESGRRNAALKARETGSPQLTPKINLVQDEMQEAGFLLLLPQYAEAGDQEGMQGQFLRWVYAPFVARNLLADLTPSLSRDYDLEVFDGRSAVTDALIFESASEQDRTGDYIASFTTEMYGRPWTLRFTSTRNFDVAFATFTPQVILVVGLISTAFLGYLLKSMRLRAENLRKIANTRARQIAEREDETRSLIENAITPVFLLDEADRIILANEAARNCFDIGTRKIEGTSFSAFVEQVPDTSPKDSNNAVGLTTDGRRLALNLQRNEWITHDGTRRTTAIVRDISAEIAAVHELSRTKTLYDQALQGARIGVFDIDISSGQSDVSDTWCSIMGLKAGCNEIDTQSNFMSRIHPEDKSVLEQADKDCISGKTSRSISEFRLRFGAEEWRWMRSDAVIVERAKDGTALRLIGTQQDITEERHARNALEASESQFRQVISAAPIGMALMDSSGKFAVVNHAFCELCGLNEKEIVEEKTLPDLMPTEDMKNIVRAVDGMIKNGDSTTYEGEHRLLRSDRTTRECLFHVSWTYNRNTDSNLFIAQIIDISEQKRVDRIKDEFVSTVSHELRTPLTSIKGALGLIKATAEGSMSASFSRLLDIASTNAERLTTIVNDILDLEKISSGEVNFDFQPVDLGSLISEAIGELTPFALQHQNELRTSLAEEALVVDADPTRLRQVLANLISNACKYSTPNTEVNLLVERIDDVAIVYVQNVGPGVPEAFRPHIFEAFSQADASDTRARGGTGLGLNISRQIVKRHNGKIGFESVADGVTVFWFTCPMSVRASQPSDRTADEGTEHPKRRKTVLHVENDLDFAEVIASGLVSKARVLQATTVAEARKLIASKNIDVVLLDWLLPDGDGLELIGEITAKLPEARIVSLSADSDRKPDPRVAVNLIKSRSAISTIAEKVLGIGHNDPKMRHYQNNLT
ncbi:CHASE domain-containing protein [Sulfitobacter aestuariivivens]|uniref:histidine kinase n=1 Tax=Sulfitobacter aestuariivivens TaxID=2766981 RepID=A0A927D032_9RHOB|nr:CHASE domain-containing protein [Sulfitobacter aestuariivivens]MBD3662598.1 CHASE domain-containing protein [Sulfitobacter aestuariivivens]